MLGNLKKFFFKKRNLDESEVEKLRNDFMSRYHHFKLLLTANNKALDIMTQIEEALKGLQPFGMTHVKAWCTMAAANVWQIIKNLNELAPGRYEELYSRFKAAKKNIDPYLDVEASPRDMELIIPLSEINKDMTDQVGSKMANLGEIMNIIKYPVSNGFVITASGYYRFMEYNDLQAEVDRLIQSADIKQIDQLHGLSASLQQLIIKSPLPKELEDAISEAYKRLEDETGKGVTVALRSSALGEDFEETSFAGQYRSALNICCENLHHAYKEVVASKYGLQAMSYRLNRGIRDESVAMCVGCTAMVKAISGGIVYSNNPVNIRDDSIVINSVWGLPKSVVDGSVPADLFVVSREREMKILKKEIPYKMHSFVCYPDEGICKMELTEDRGSLPSLTEEQVIELAGISLKLEGHYGVPQDIEWAVDENGRIVLLQCRPLKQAGVQRLETLEHVQEKELDSIILAGGSTASPGVAAGPVFVVKKDMDILQFPEGAVLVTSQALPVWAAVLGRAAAVVTEQGGLTGHLANVAREFNVPGIFGLPGVIRELRSGQMITVDADRARIYNGREDSLLVRRQEQKKLMEGSPVFDALSGAARYIVPLNLLDPDAPSFRPENCITLHDMTRYCHEKVVHEMFNFGREHYFPERSSKQLYCRVPMQWWVLNLDDGFREEIKGKYIQIENIVSIPMLALWEGISSIPWQGPPPIDGKGFMSVMFEATANRSLAPGAPTKYASRNYFMISRNYCSLRSRLGFHFSTIETLVSERPVENYINFQFKGGAANFHRRLNRVLFIKDILEEFDFRVDIREDNLIARIEDREMDFMKDRLKILGYITIHTRQLDMIMSRVSSVKYYRDKMVKDINVLIGLD